MLKAFDRVLEWITAIVKYVMLVHDLVIFFITTFTVFTRYLLNYVPSWSEEIPRYLLVWITYLGAALAVKYKEHISLDVFFNLMPLRARQVGHLILNGLIAIVGVIMVVFGIGLVRPVRRRPDGVHSRHELLVLSGHAHLRRADAPLHHPGYLEEDPGISGRQEEASVVGDGSRSRVALRSRIPYE